MIHLSLRWPLGVAACLVVAVPLRLAAAPTSPLFDPDVFFAGRTEGQGTLKVLLSPPKPVTVHGSGHVDAGVLTLDQTVNEGDKPATTRQWVFRPVGPGRYAGTLSDAAGPVAGNTDGNRLHLHIHMKGGIVADQRIDLAEDGRSAHNRMTFRKFGLVVARLDETIRRVP